LQEQEHTSAPDALPGLLLLPHASIRSGRQFFFFTAGVRMHFYSFAF
jgi:hypothetical protein